MAPTIDEVRKRFATTGPDAEQRTMDEARRTVDDFEAEIEKRSTGAGKAPSRAPGDPTPAPGPASSSTDPGGVLPSRRVGREAPTIARVEGGGSDRMGSAVRRARMSSEAARDRRFSVVDDGGDLLINFGKHRGSKVSELAEDSNGRSYLAWILGWADCPAFVREIIQSRILKDPGLGMPGDTPSILGDDDVPF